MNSNQIKTSLLYYFRFKRQCIAAPEIKLDSYNRLGISDILALNKNGRVTDVEIKMSIQDLKNDFNKSKHNYYSDDNYLYECNLVPNYFYFCIPIELKEKIVSNGYIKELEEIKYAGIMIYNEKSLYKNREIFVYKKSPLINKETNEVYYKDLILKRLTYECYNYYKEKSLK